VVEENDTAWVVVAGRLFQVNLRQNDGSVEVECPKVGCKTIGKTYGEALPAIRGLIAEHLKKEEPCHPST